MPRVLAFLILSSLIVLNAEAQFEIETNANGTSVTITNYSGPLDVVIPPSIDGLTVTSIGDYAFAVTEITKVTIPDSVTNIGDDAFNACFDLTNVSSLESVTTIGYAAFSFTGLTTLIIPSGVTNMGDSAFGSCSDLTNLTFGYGITSIQSNLFLACSSLPNVTIPSTVTNIGSYAFSACDDLTEVFFTGNAPEVDSTVFQNYLHYGFHGVEISNYYTATAYYLPGTTGWDQFMSNTLMAATEDSPTNLFIPTVLWNPTIQATGTNFGVQNGQYGFDITATTNLPIAIEACDDLTQSNWVVLQRLTLTNGLYHFSEPFDATRPSRFYRIGFP